MKNLKRMCNWYNPFTAITNKGEAFELDNIIIYSEDGILIETDKGWISQSNNDRDELEIKPDIKRKTKIDFNCKENFVIRSEQKSYKLDRRYTLYLYYKNVQYAFNGLELDSLFLNIKYTILGDYQNEIVIGDRHKKSDAIRYQEKFKQEVAKIDSYHLQYHGNEFKKALKELAKIQKDFEAAREYEKTLTIDNWRELIREHDIKKLENNKKIKQ